jgi:hypothetical protein
MPNVELKFIPVGYVNSKSQTGKTQRFSHLSPLSFASRESQGKFFVVFSITGEGGTQLSFEIFNQDNTPVLIGKRFFSGAFGGGSTKAGVDISTGLWLEAGEVIETIEFEAGVATRMIHGKAVVVANNTEVSNVVTFSMEQTPTIGTGFQRGQAYQAPITEPAAVTITEPLLPEISFLPEAHAEPEPIVDIWSTLSQETKTIINDIPAKIKAPNWFVNNNINWLLEGHISEAEFLRGYYDYVKKGTIILIDEPEPIVDQVSTNMIRQELLNFTIVNNRIQGSIKFIATDAFNPYYYNKEITAYLQLISNGKTIHIKSNPLRFTQTEKDELINFDEHAYDLDMINVESYARNNVDLDMSNVFAFTIEAGKEPTVAGKTGLMGAGVLGIIGILMLGGFIADHVRRKR